MYDIGISGVLNTRAVEIPRWFEQNWLNCAFRATRAIGVAKEMKGKHDRGATSDHWLLVAAKGGRCDITVNDQRVSLETGSLALLPPSSFYNLRVHTTSIELCKLQLLLIGNLASTINPLNQLALPYVMQTQDREHFHEAWATIDQFKKKKFALAHFSDRMQVDLILNRWLLEIVLAMIEAKAFAQEQTDIPDWLVSVRAYIETYYFEPDLHMDRIAAAGDVSKGYCQRVFKQVYGDTPIAYLHRYRMMIVEKLLTTNQDLTIQYLMRRCGYRSRSLFYVMFKKYHGQTPAAYRTKARR